MLKMNKLSLNMITTHYMTSSKKKYDFKRDVVINGKVIDNFKQGKDNTWKAIRQYWYAYKAQYCLNKSGVIALHNLFLYPYLSYHNHVWGSIYKTNLRRLANLQIKVNCVLKIKMFAEGWVVYHRTRGFPRVHLARGAQRWWPGGLWGPTRQTS